MNIQQLRESVKMMDADRAIAEISRYIDARPDDDEAYLLRGMKYFASGRRAPAINDYHRALAINPDSRAAQALQAANDILNFYNKDLFNP